MFDCKLFARQQLQEEYGIVVDNGPPLLSVEVVSPFLSKDPQVFQLFASVQNCNGTKRTTSR